MFHCKGVILCFNCNLNPLVQIFFVEDAKKDVNAKWDFQIWFSRVDFDSLNFEFLFNFGARNPKCNLDYFF